MWENVAGLGNSFKSSGTCTYKVYNNINHVNQATTDSLCNLFISLYNQPSKHRASVQK